MKEFDLCRLMTLPAGFRMLYAVGMMDNWDDWATLPRRMSAECVNTLQEQTDKLCLAIDDGNICVSL